VIENAPSTSLLISLKINTLSRHVYLNRILRPFTNQTSTSTSLSFELANTSGVKIQVYNLSGRLVKSIRKKNLGQGSHIIDIEGANLSAGTYVVKLSAGRQQATTKFVKI